MDSELRSNCCYHPTWRRAPSIHSWYRTQSSIITTAIIKKSTVLTVHHSWIYQDAPNVHWSEKLSTRFMSTVGQEARWWLSLGELGGESTLLLPGGGLADGGDGFNSLDDDEVMMVINLLQKYVVDLLGMLYMQALMAEELDSKATNICSRCFRSFPSFICAKTNLGVQTARHCWDGRPDRSCQVKNNDCTFWHFPFWNSLNRQLVEEASYLDPNRCFCRYCRCL